MGCQNGGTDTPTTKESQKANMLYPIVNQSSNQEWPGNDEAKVHDFSCKKDANDNEIPYEDSTRICLPPSFKEFMRGEDIWLRPDAYIREILHEQETDRLKAERRK